MEAEYPGITLYRLKREALKKSLLKQLVPKEITRKNTIEHKLTEARKRKRRRESSLVSPQIPSVGRKRATTVSVPRPTDHARSKSLAVPVKGRKRSNSLVRREGKRNLLGNSLFINKVEDKKDKGRDVFKVYSIFDPVEIEPSRERDIMLGIAEDNNLVLDDNMSVYDIHFCLVLVHMNISFFPREMSNLFEDYLYKSASDPLEVPSSPGLKILDYMISPQLFRLEKGYLLSYFLTCIDIESFKVAITLRDGINNIKGEGKIKIFTSNQLQTFLMETDEKGGLTLEEAVYLLLFFLRKQEVGYINCTEDYPSVIEYFHLKNFGPRIDPESKDSI